MDVLYRVFGLIAGLSERGSRNRVNGVGMNWWLLVAIGVFAGFAIAEVVEAISNRGEASPLALSTVLADDGMANRYVAVKGQFDPDATLTRKDEGGEEKTPGEIWIPLVDEAAGRALYVKINLKQLEEKQEKSDGYVRGMLRGMDKDLKSHVSRSAPESAGIRIDNRFVLVAGQKPAGLWIWLVVAIVMTIVTSMMIAVIVKRYVVFRASAAPAPSRYPTPASIEATAPAASMRASGVFVFNQTDRRRFLDIEVALAEMESNDPALVTNINASENFMGTVTRNLAGLWAMVMKSGTIERPQFGRLYAGWKPRPALRVRYTDAINGNPSQVVLSFDNDSDRARGFEAISKLARP